MVRESDNDEVFDEDEIAEGFDEEIVGAEDLDVEDLDVDVIEDELDVEDDAEDVVADADLDDDDAGDAVAVVVDDDDEVDDSDVELALDEVLAETILRTSVPEDDDDGASDPELAVEAAEAILPKQDDEFRCASCRLLKKVSQLADPAQMLCRDCV